MSERIAKEFESCQLGDKRLNNLAAGCDVC